MFRLAVLFAACLLAAGPAHACKCSFENAESHAQKILADPAYSVVNAHVMDVSRDPAYGYNITLTVKAVSHGAVPLGMIRAKTGGTSCDVWPKADTTRAFLLKRLDDGAYKIVGDCAAAMLSRAGKM